jgi:PAS domain S-box-containing protein
MNPFMKEDFLSEYLKHEKFILDSLGDEVLIFDTEFKLLYANGKFLNNRGVSLVEVKGRTCNQLLHNLEEGCSFTDRICPLKEVLKSSLPIRVSYKLGEKYLKINASPLKDKKGKIIGIIGLFKDITETEKEKMESEEKYRDLIEKSHDAIAILQDDQIKLANQKIVDLIGYSREELKELDFKKAIAPEYREMVLDRYMRRQRGEEVPDHYELAILTKNEQRKDVELNVALIEYERKIASYCFLRDVTEKKKAQRELNKLIYYLDNIINTSQVAITVVDNEKNFSIFNQGAERLTGYKSEEVIGKKKLEDFYSDKKELENILNKLSDKGLIENLETTLLKKDGSQVPISISVSLLKDRQGRPIGSIGISTDITERKRIEKELRESEARLNAIIKNTPNVAIESFDINGKILYWNKAEEKVFGWSGAEALGKTIDRLILDRESSDEFLKTLREVDKTNKPCGPSEWKCKNKSGMEIVTYSTIFSIPSTDGRKEFICMDVDITGLKKAQEALRKSEEKYRFLYEKSSTVNLIIGIDGVIKDVNEEAIKKFGYSKEEIVGRSALDFVVPEQKDEVALLLEKDFKREHTPEMEIEICAKDGTAYTLLFSPGSSMLYEGDQPNCILVTGIDVTERREAKKALRENDEKFRKLAEQLPNMIFINKKGGVVYANQKCEEVLGYKREEFYAPDFDYLELIAPEYRESIKENFTRHMKDEEVQSFEYKLITKKGEEIEAILATKLIAYEGENAILGIVTDITQRKNIEQKIFQTNRELKVLNSIASIANQSLNLDVILRETLEKVLELIDCQAGGIYLLNQENEELELKFCKGLSPDAVKEIDRLKLGEGFSGRIALAGEPLMVEDISRDSRLTRLIMRKEELHSFLGVPLKSKGKVLGNLFVISQKNRKYHQEEISLLLSIGNQIGMAVENAYLFQETQQWIIQLEAIRNITNRLNKLNDVRTVAFAVMDEIKKVIEFDNCRVFLLSENREELIPIAFGSAVEEYKGETEEALRLKIGEGITGWVAQTGEPQLIDDGERHPRSRHVPGSPYVDESIIASPMIYEGEVRGVITLSKLSLRQFNQNHLSLLNILANETAVAIENAKLFESLKQAYARLKEAQEQLIQSEKLRALGEMAGGVAHDFNNLLGAILGRAQLLLLNAQDAKTKKGLKVIEKAALDGAETVRRIQEFTRLRADENFVMVDINQILRESLEITKPRWKDEAQKKGVLIQVELSLDKDLPLVTGNPSELREVFVNMILNAVDAMPSGGTITVSSESNERNIVASVADTGMGMPEEVKRKVFDPFFTTKGPKGNGLGMSVAYGIIVRHKGKIKIETQEGKGAAFTVKLPKGELDLKARVKEKSAAEENRCENILIIDDEPAIRELLCDILQSEGHRTMAVDDSLKGLGLFEKEDFGIVFTDLSMPEMSGWELTDKLKSLNPEVVIIMVTGWGTQVESNKLKEHKVDFLMTKPFEIKKLFEILNQAQRLKKDREVKKQEMVSF